MDVMPASSYRHKGLNIMKCPSGTEHLFCREASSRNQFSLFVPVLQTHAARLAPSGVYTAAYSYGFRRLRTRQMSRLYFAMTLRRESVSNAAAGFQSGEKAI